MSKNIADPRETLDRMWKQPGNADNVPDLLEGLSAALDLADRLDTEAEELRDFSGGMSDEAEWCEATAIRIRTTITTALERAA